MLHIDITYDMLHVTWCMLYVELWTACCNMLHVDITYGHPYKVYPYKVYPLLQSVSLQSVSVLPSVPLTKCTSYKVYPFQSVSI